MQYEIRSCSRRLKVNGQVEKKVLELRASGMGIKRIAREAKVAMRTVYRILEKAASQHRCRSLEM